MKYWTSINDQNKKNKKHTGSYKLKANENIPLKQDDAHGWIWNDTAPSRYVWPQPSGMFDFGPNSEWVFSSSAGSHGGRFTGYTVCGEESQWCIFMQHPQGGSMMKVNHSDFHSMPTWFNAVHSRPRLQQVLCSPTRLDRVKQRCRAEGTAALWHLSVTVAFKLQWGVATKSGKDQMKNKGSQASMIVLQ